MMLISFIQVCDGQPTKATRMMQAEEAVLTLVRENPHQILHHLLQVLEDEVAVGLAAADQRVRV